jgi:hypothetical protein
VRWSQGEAYVLASCEGCGHDWTVAQLLTLTPQIPPAQAALARALAGENPAPDGENALRNDEASDLPKE